MNISVPHRNAHAQTHTHASNRLGTGIYKIYTHAYTKKNLATKVKCKHHQVFQHANASVRVCEKKTKKKNEEGG